MKKSIASILLATAMISSTFMPVQAAPTATGLTVENASNSHAPWEGGINLQGVTCLNSYLSLVTLKGVQDSNGVKGVRFHVMGYTTTGACTSDYVFPGDSDGEGNWYTYLNFKKIPRVDYYKIQAFPIDSNGNTLESAMLWNPSYQWSKNVKYDNVKPIGYVNIWGTNGNWNTAGTYDGNPVTNGTGVSVRAGASEPWYRGSGIMSVECHLFKENTLVQSKYAVNSQPDAIGNGTYEAAFDYSSLVGQGQTARFFVRTIIYDFANNDTVIDNYFTYDPLSR